MSAAPPGAVVRIYYDGLELAPRDWLRTPTGRTYAVLSVRLQLRGAHLGRQHLVCRVVGAGEKPSGRVRSLHWYPRGRRRSVGAAR